MSLSVFRAAELAPHAEALLCEGVRLNFAALAARTRARCAELAALGVTLHDARPVALLVDNSLAMFEFLYALFAMRVPLVPIQPRLTGPERAQLQTLCGAELCIDPARTAPSGDARFHSAVFEFEHAPPADDERALAFVATSGSTGTPKIVELSRRAFLALARADAERVPPRPEDRALLCLPLAHVGGLSVVIRCLLARRACVVFGAGPRAILQTLPELAEVLVRERITLLSLVPIVLKRLLAEAPSTLQRAPLHAVLLGGQACDEELFLEARAFALPVLTSYGMTECCSQICTLALPVPERVAARRGVVGVGFAMPGVELRVEGELIAVRGPTLFSGYLGAPSPFDAAGFFSTGDRGEFDREQGLFVFGRESALIISGGENIDPVEVEHALISCGGLREAAVFSVSDPEFGARVAAAIEPIDLARFDERALFAALDRRLAAFKQPRVVCVFEALPRLASGKLDRLRIALESPPRLRPAQRAPRSDTRA